MSDFKPSARIIADSYNEHCGTRLTTMEMRLHRWMLPVLAANHDFSLTEDDHRAKGVLHDIRALQDEPVYPAIWSKERLGQQTTAPIGNRNLRDIVNIWDEARRACVYAAELLAAQGVHRSIAMRLLEPFQAATVICTSTNYEKFFTRYTVPQNAREPLADAEINAAATAMRRAYDTSTPEKLEPGQWHLPYLTAWDLSNLNINYAVRLSIMRCLHADARAQLPNDRDLYRTLTLSESLDPAVLTHLAVPAAADDLDIGHFDGWHQLSDLDYQAYL